MFASISRKVWRISPRAFCCLSSFAITAVILDGTRYSLACRYSRAGRIVEWRNVSRLRHWPTHDGRTTGPGVRRAGSIVALTPEESHKFLALNGTASCSAARAVSQRREAFL